MHRNRFYEFAAHHFNFSSPDQTAEQSQTLGRLHFTEPVNRPTFVVALALQIVKLDPRRLCLTLAIKKKHPKRSRLMLAHVSSDDVNLRFYPDRTYRHRID